MSYVTIVKSQRAQATEQNHTVTLSTHQGQLNAVLAEQTFTFDWRQIAPLAGNEREVSGGRYSLLIAGTSYEIYARRLPKADEQGSRTYEIQLAGQTFEVTVEDERTHLLEGLSKSGASSGIARVQAPMPGLVVNTLVAPGDSVTAGQTVVILEAMKMENDLPAPINGTIKEVRVHKGDTVDNGQILVTIEP